MKNMTYNKAFLLKIEMISLNFLILSCNYFSLNCIGLAECYDSHFTMIQIYHSFTVFGDDVEQQERSGKTEYISPLHICLSKHFTI